MAHPIFSEDHDLIRAQLRRFVDERVRPHGPKWEEAGFVPREILREMGDLGFLSLRVPEALGGAGLDARASVVLAEEVGRSSFGGFAITVLVHTDMASPHLVRFGSKRQLEKYLPGVVAGRTVTAVGVTEPGAGSDVAGIRTRAVRDGDAYVLNGAKMFITNGVHGDLYFIAARTDPEAKGSRAITMFIVESRRARPASASAACSTRPAGARRTPPNSSSRIAACRPRTCWARRTAASIRSWPTSRPSGW